MTKQQAINILNGLEQSLDDYCELNDEGKTAFRMGITALELFGNSEQLPSAQTEQRWIPVTERPPEEDEQVFVYLFDDSPYIAWLSDGVWHTDDFIIDKDDEPAAWMQLPEPYSEEGGKA